MNIHHISFVENIIKPNKNEILFSVFQCWKKNNRFKVQQTHLKNEILLNSILISLQKNKNPFECESSQKQSQYLEKNKSL